MATENKQWLEVNIPVPEEFKQFTSEKCTSPLKRMT